MSFKEFFSGPTGKLFIVMIVVEIILAAIWLPYVLSL